MARENEVWLTTRRRQALYKAAPEFYMTLSRYKVHSHPDGSFTYLEVSLRDQEIIATHLMNVPAY